MELALNTESLQVGRGEALRRRRLCRGQHEEDYGAVAEEWQQYSEGKWHGAEGRRGTIYGGRPEHVRSRPSATQGLTIAFPFH